MTEEKEKKVSEELKIIASRNDGILVAKEVVRYARNSKTALHDRFEWDNGLAAEKYRIMQAQNIIRMRMCEVPVNDEDKKISVREYVSLTSERGEGEYYHITNVLKSKNFKEQMLIDAKNELRNFTNKYAALNELLEVHNVIKKILEIE